MKANEISFKCRYGTIRGLQWGTGQAKKILASHGWLDNSASFSELAPLLCQLGYEITAFDFPGHGRSDHRAPGHNYLLMNYLTDLHEVVMQLPGNDWIYLGHSMGAGVGQMYLTACPEKFNHLIMVENLGAIPAYESGKGPEILKSALNSWQHHSLEHKNYYPDIKTAAEARLQVTPMQESLIMPMIERGITETPKGLHWSTDKRLRLSSLTRLTEEQITDYLSATVVPTHLILASPKTYAMRYASVENRIAALNPRWYDVVEGDHHIHLTNSQAVFHVIEKRLSENA